MYQGGRRFESSQCPGVPQSNKWCSNLRLDQSCRGYPPGTTSESWPRYRYPGCFLVRNLSGCSHSQTSACRINCPWHPPRYARSRRQGRAVMRTLWDRANANACAMRLCSVYYSKRFASACTPMLYREQRDRLCLESFLAADFRSSNESPLHVLNLSCTHVRIHMAISVVLTYIRPLILTTWMQRVSALPPLYWHIATTEVRRYYSTYDQYARVSLAFLNIYGLKQ